jgi:hypothetical protein
LERTARPCPLQGCGNVAPERGCVSPPHAGPFGFVETASFWYRANGDRDGPVAPLVPRAIFGARARRRPST